MEKRKKLATLLEATSQECSYSDGGDCEVNEEIIRQNVWGWESATAAASDIWSSIHNILLSGKLVFAYRNGYGGSELAQLVVVRNIDQRDGKLLDDYGIGMFTTGYSVLLPHVPYSYVEGEVTEDLKKYKVDKKIIETYKQIIKDEITSN